MKRKYQLTREEVKHIFKLKLEAVVWAVAHPALAFIYYSPRTSKFDRFIARHFSESAVQKSFNCPTSCISNWKRKTLNLIKSLVGHSICIK